MIGAQDQLGADLVFRGSSPVSIGTHPGTQPVSPPRRCCSRCSAAYRAERDSPNMPASSILV